MLWTPGSECPGHSCKWQPGLQAKLPEVPLKVWVFKSLLMPLFLMGCFPVDFQDVKRPLRTKSVKSPIKVGKRPINEGKRPIKAKVLVSVSVVSLMGCFRAPQPWRKTAPLKRPIKRSMRFGARNSQLEIANCWRSSIAPSHRNAALLDCLTGLRNRHDI